MSETTGRIFTALFATVNGVTVEIASASFNLGFLIFTGIVKKLLKSATNKKKKRNKRNNCHFS